MASLLLIGACAFFVPRAPLLSSPRCNIALSETPDVVPDAKLADVIPAVDVTPAAEEINARQPSEFEEYKSRVGKGVNADERNPDGSIPIKFNFDIRWFLFLGIFAAGEDSILEVTAPLRELSVGGVQPFDAIISTLAGPVVRGDPDARGLHEVPTGGLAILVAYFVYWKGWLDDGMQAVKRQMQIRRDSGRN